MEDSNTASIRLVLQKFQDGYTARDVARLDEFMKLFVQDDNIEMIGIGASKRAENEWFEGPARIREIVESDWMYWGDVKLDVEGAKITVQGMRHGFPQWEPLHRPKSSIPPSNSISMI